MSARKWLFGVFLMSSSAADYAQTVCTPTIEDHPYWGTAIFRPHSNNLLQCTVTLVAEWLANLGEQGAIPESLYLGRSIDYPWLSSLMVQSALAHPDWDVEMGKSLVVHENALVGEMLSREAIVEQLQMPFSATGYVVSGVSVEKVLIGEISVVAPEFLPVNGLVPFDAQVWIHLKPNRWRALICPVSIEQ